MLARSTFVRLCRARDRLRETDDQPLSIRAVAREADISPFHFIRQFHALFGETPHQFRIHAQLDRAMELLALSSYSVTDVCMEVGFASLGSFSVPVGEFRWLTVVSPEGPDDLELSLEPNTNPAGKTFQEAIFKQGIPITAFES